jgi:hypothetical protein
VAGENTRSNLDGVYKVVYPDGPVNPFPEQTPLREMITFREDKKLGEEYHQSIILSLPGGVSYGGSAGLVYDLDGYVPADIKKAKVKGSEFTIQEAISYGAAKAARGGAESFKDIVGHLFEAMSITGYRRCEASLLHGQSASGLGEVESVASNVVTIKELSWAPGVWIGCKGHRVAFWNTGFGTKRLDTTITSVDIENRKITVASAAGVVATDLVLFGAGASGISGQRKDGSTWNDGIGMTAAMRASGTVYSLDNSVYEIWKAPSKDIGGVDLAFDNIGALLMDMFVKGAGGQLVGVCSVKTWTNLISPEIAVRRHDASYNKEKVTVGHEGIEFRHMTGVLKIIAHPMAKYGEFFIFNPKEWRRIGSTDFTFEQDVGSNVKKIFLHLAGKNGFEIRGYFDNAPFTRRLGVAGINFNIVNSN